MNKKLIAAAIAAVMAAPVVSAADTTLYGKAHVDIRSEDTGSSDNYSANSNASRIGIKGSEDLGDGLKAIFQFEMQYDMTDSAGSDDLLKSRNSFVGLSGGFGTFLVGKHDTPAKWALNATKLSKVSDSIVDFENSNGFSEVRANDAIAYISPSFSGFTVAAAIIPGEETGNVTTTKTAGLNAAKTAVVVNTNTNANAADGLADAYSLGAMYSGGGLKVGVGYEVFSDSIYGGGAAGDQKMWQVTAAYTFGDFMVGGAYENTDDFGGRNGDEAETWALHARAAFGNNYAFVQYGNDEHKLAAGSSGTAVDDETFGIGVGHKFSKRTQVYAAYKNVDNGLVGGQDEDAFALGMVHDF